MNRIEKEAQALSGGNEVKYKKELEKLSKDTLNLGSKLDYRSAKEKGNEAWSGFERRDQRLLEINQRDLVNDLTNYSTNPVLVEALNRTDAAQKFSTKTYIDNFLFSLML
jgi:SecD/SecF fusion protein